MGKRKEKKKTKPPNHNVIIEMKISPFSKKKQNVAGYPKVEKEKGCIGSLTICC
jgi:hypothetical protein